MQRHEEPCKRRLCARRSDDTDARSEARRCFGRSDRRAQADRPTLRSIPPTRARAPFDASVDPTDARNLFTFLDDPPVPADNNGTEREIRSLTAARSDGGTHRADWSAAAFARLKSVIVTGMKNQVRFIQYGIEVVRAKRRGGAASVYHCP